MNKSTPPKHFLLYVTASVFLFSAMFPGLIKVLSFLVVFVIGAGVAVAVLGFISFLLSRLNF